MCFILLLWSSDCSSTVRYRPVPVVVTALWLDFTKNFTKLWRWQRWWWYEAGNQRLCHLSSIVFSMEVSPAKHFTPPSHSFTTIIHFTHWNTRPSEGGLGRMKKATDIWHNWAWLNTCTFCTHSECCIIISQDRYSDLNEEKCESKFSGKSSTGGIFCQIIFDTCSLPLPVG